MKTQVSCQGHFEFFQTLRPLRPGTISQRIRSAVLSDLLCRCNGWRCVARASGRGDGGKSESDKPAGGEEFLDPESILRQVIRESGMRIVMANREEEEETYEVKPASAWSNLRDIFTRGTLIDQV